MSEVDILKEIINLICANLLLISTIGTMVLVYYAWRGGRLEILKNKPVVNMIDAKLDYKKEDNYGVVEICYNNTGGNAQLPEWGWELKLKNKKIYSGGWYPIHESEWVEGMGGYNTHSYIRGNGPDITKRSLSFEIKNRNKEFDILDLLTIWVRYSDNLRKKWFSKSKSIYLNGKWEMKQNKKPKREIKKRKLKGVNLE